MLRRRSNRRLSKIKRKRPIQFERLESRALLAALPMGATPMDTGEFLLGKVAVTPVLFESDGSIDTETQNWTPEEIDQTLAKVSEGVNWWRDLLATQTEVHSLEFVIDDTYALNPFSTGYEPIERTSDQFNRYVGEFVVAQGYGDAGSIEEAVRSFNHQQRLELEADWAFTIFIVDSSEGSGFFESGGTFSGAFAYAGGLFIICPSSRPASTIAHEMGHIFWARDEYPGGSSWTEKRGYYDAQNWNAADNTSEGFEQEVSIMRAGAPLNSAYTGLVSPESTLAMVGWRDSDGDGIFDLLDVPLALDASGFFDAQSSIYHFSGTASAVALRNLNSSGPQSDITLNRVSEIQYSLDGGGWITAATPDQQSVEFDLSVPISQSFNEIAWRVVDTSSGVESVPVTGSTLLPALSHASVSGLTFVDEDGDSQLDQTDVPLVAADLKVLTIDGQELFGGEIDAATVGWLDGRDGALLSADGLYSRESISARPAGILGDRVVFQSYDTLRNGYVVEWSTEVVLQADFNELVGEVELRAIGVGDGSIARIEAYDAFGNMLSRTATGLLPLGVEEVLRIEDANGRIASIRAYGHAGTEVAFDRIEFGFTSVVRTDAGGTFRLENLTDGQYLVGLTPELLIHEFLEPSILVNVENGVSDPLLSPARRVDSPLHNLELPEDVDKNNIVTPGDALVVVNNLSRYGSRIITAVDESQYAVDVGNDGIVSALDALRVISYLSVNQANAEGEAGPGQTDAAIAWQGSTPASGAGFFNARSTQDTCFAMHMVDSADAGISGQSRIMVTTDTTMSGHVAAKTSRSPNIGGSDSGAFGNTVVPSVDVALGRDNLVVIQEELNQLEEAFFSENMEPKES